MAMKQPEKGADRRRLKDLAFSKGLLSRTPSERPGASLLLSKTVLKNQGRDVVKKGQRKNRFLFSFTGFLAPISAGGKIGELSDLATGNPILYLDFPQGRMKLFGTIVYPKNRYLTLQFARKNVLCEDPFDSMVIFSDAWWIGRKEDNPAEIQLKFPNELHEGKQADCDFKGGAGDTVGDSTTGRPPIKEQAKLFCLDDELTDDTSEASDHLIKDLMQVTPIRQSTRTAGKSLNYAEHSSGEESICGETDKSDEMNDQTIDKVFGAVEARSSNPNSEMLSTQFSYGTLKNGKNRKAEVEETSPSLKHSEDKTSNKQGTLVQATFSTLCESHKEGIRRQG